MSTCLGCVDLPHIDVLRGLHAHYKRLTYQGLPVPLGVRRGEQQYQHVRYHERRDWAPPTQQEESPFVLTGGSWVRRGLVQVWEEAS